MWSSATKNLLVKSVDRHKRTALLAGAGLLFFAVGLAPILKPIAEATTNLLIKQLVNRLSPLSHDRLWLLANHHFSQGHAQKAIRLCEELLKRFPAKLDRGQRRQVYAMLGLSYGNIGKEEKKFEIYEQLVQLDPAYGHFLKGVAFDSLGQWHEARKELELALETGSSNFPLDVSARQLIQQVLKRYEVGIP